MNYEKILKSHLLLGIVQKFMRTTYIETPVYVTSILIDKELVIELTYQS